MPQELGYGVATRVTTTGYTTITSGPARLIGAMANSTGTCSFSFYSCKATASCSTTVGSNNIVYATVAGATANSAIFYPFPAQMVNGVVVHLGGSADPRVTLFWSPV